MPERETIVWAHDLARELLEPLGRRWLHVQAVGTLATSISAHFDVDGPVLVMAAYLHDIGYAPPIAVTGFHPLDGARFLRNLGHERLATLVAHHSAARVEAGLRGLRDYEQEFPYQDSAVDHALTFCDMTTGPDGSRVTLDDRLIEITGRYGRDHTVTRALLSARQHLELCCVATGSRCLSR